MESEMAAVSLAEARAGIRSCTTCSKAKAKCVRQSGAEICDRCTRLRKECHSREPVLRRRKTVKTTRTAQLEQLESKIEHLVNALSATQTNGSSSTVSPPLSARPENPPQLLSLDRSHSNMCPEIPAEYLEPDTGPSQESAAAFAPPKSIEGQCQFTGFTENRDYNDLGVTISEAEILLDRYQRLMSYALPFVVLPGEITARQLYLQKPFLLHAIGTVTYFHDLPKQQIMVKQMMRDVSERVLMNNEKTLDIIQGILVLVAWYHPHVFWNQQVTNLLHLAIALTIDMAIDRPSGSCIDFKSQMKAAHATTHPDLPAMPNLIKSPSSDDHRALAGVFYLTSMLASSFKKIDALSYTKYLDSCLQNLEAAKEYESDLFLVQMVRLQHLAEDTHTTETPTAPMQMYVKAFEADLLKIRQNDPCKTENIFLKLQYSSAAILVWELSLNEMLENKTQPLRNHLDDLYRCLEAIRGFLDVYFSIPTAAYLTIPFSVFGQFAHTFIVLTKLASLEVEGWDMKSLHESMNFSAVIDDAASRFEAATKSSPDGLDVQNDAFHKWATRVRWMKNIYEAKAAMEGGGTGDDGLHTRPDAVKTLFRPPEAYIEAAAAGAQQPTPPDDMMSGDFFNYLDDNFWNSFGGEYDFNMPDVAML